VNTIAREAAERNERLVQRASHRYIVHAGRCYSWFIGL